jgi:hypothetical protein
MRENDERWIELCKQAFVERDSGKLAELIEEINRVLESNKYRLQSPADQKPKE